MGMRLVRRPRRYSSAELLMQRRRRRLRPYCFAMGIYPIVVSGVLLLVLAVWELVRVLQHR